MAGVRRIQPEFAFKPKEECAPGAAEIPTNFHPESFDTGIVGGADGLLSDSIASIHNNLAYLPHKNDPRLRPRFMIM